jgi:hypothetical protein
VPEDEPLLVLDIASADITAVVWEHPAVSVQLRGAAARDLAQTTRLHIGRMLELRIDGIPAVRATIMGEIDSGSMYVASPSAALRERLTKVHKALEKR